MKIIGALLWLICSTAVWATTGYQAGVARARITPPLPAWLSGYAARTNASHEVLLDLWAKALALQDPSGRRVVIVTMDLIGLPREVSTEVAARVNKKYGLTRSQLLLNTSHTHSGPAVWPNLSVMFELSPEDASRSMDYAQQLVRTLVELVGSALDGLSPAQLACGHGSVGFAINRREPAPDGFRIGVNTNAPMDHDVPVLSISYSAGTLKAVLFGYACHNTTLGGNRYQVNGDYAGFAQGELERNHPGTTAMFLMLCGGDQNPHPRGTVALAAQHGQSLAREVDQVLAGKLVPVRAPLRCAFLETDLRFAPHSRSTFETESKSPDRFQRRRAALMLQHYDEQRPVREVPYPVQAIRLGNDLTLVALGGEVVIDYALRTKRMFPKENLIVSGYCNEVACYIPSLRVLKEGGYEPVTSMIYYGQPGPFQEDVEDRVFAAIERVLRRTGAKPGAAF
jgi:neutral ceramidase